MDNNIQDIKSKVGSAAEGIIASGLGLQKKGNSYRCPNNYVHKHGDRNPSMGWHNESLNFHCFGCGMLIDIYSYYREHLNFTHQEIVREILGEPDTTRKSMSVKRDEFKEELKKISELSDECIAYMKLRGLTEETMNAFQIKTYDNRIAFPYYRYETIVGYKTRKPLKDPGKPKYMSIAGSKPFLFNSHNVPPQDELIICEGEFDCMCIWQSGFKNVVSVGAGANSISALVEQADEYLKAFKYLIIVSDNDEAGINMDKAFLEKYNGSVKLVDKSLYHKKDINEELVKYGSESVNAIIESGRFKIEGRRDLDKSPYKGIVRREGKYIPTGLTTIDNAINDLAPGCVTLITGRSNGGKTTLTRQIIANGINHGNKVYAISGEGDQETFINELYQCVIGRDKHRYTSVIINKKWHKEPLPEVLSALQQWHKGKLTLFNKGESHLKSTNELFSMIEFELKMNRYNLIVIDNLMSILSAKAVEKNEAQADFMQRCHDLANCYRTHIILVLHPNKEYRKGMDMDFEQISGTSDLSNKADNILCVTREYDQTEKSKGIDGKVTILKNRYYSNLDTCKLRFDIETLQLLETKDGEIVRYLFGWEKYLSNQHNVSLESFTKEDVPW